MFDRFGVRRLALCAMLGLLCAWTAPCQAATLHAIVICDTLDETIGKGVCRNLNNFHYELERIADYADLELSEEIFSGDDYDAVQIFDYVHALEVESDDVVVYYHSSHGYRTSMMEECWPALFFGWENQALRLSDVVDVIKQKPQRFALVMADVCNNFVPDEHAPEFYCKQTDLWDYLSGWWDSDDTVKRDNYKHLFRDFHGTIVSCGAQPGQYSWINLYTGSFFTNSVLSSLRECTRELCTDWESIFSLAVTKTVGLSQSYPGVTRQDPQYQIEEIH